MAKEKHAESNLLLVAASTTNFCLQIFSATLLAAKFLKISRHATGKYH